MRSGPDLPGPGESWPPLEDVRPSGPWPMTDGQIKAAATSQLAMTATYASTIAQIEEAVRELERQEKAHAAVYQRALSSSRDIFASTVRGLLMTCRAAEDTLLSRDDTDEED